MKKPKNTQKVVESLKAAAVALGLDLSVVKKAKELACPAFKPGNRIDLPELRKWIAANEEKLKVAGETLSLKDQKTNEEIRKLRIANDLKEKELVKRAGVVEAHAKMTERVRKLLEQKLENEYPSLVAQLDIAQARVKGKQLHDQIIAEFQALTKELWKL